jgi:hypothetical protein
MALHTPTIHTPADPGFSCITIRQGLQDYRAGERDLK